MEIYDTLPRRLTDLSLPGEMLPGLLRGTLLEEYLFSNLSEILMEVLEAPGVGKSYQLGIAVVLG